MLDPFDHALSTEGELRAIYDPPKGLAARKEIRHLDEHCRAFLAVSPFVLVASADTQGRCDVTPRGGPPGFVSVLDERRLAIPDATGNRRIDTLRNIVSGGSAGVLFLIPGSEVTLRVNGRACVSDDPELLSKLTAVGKPPRTAIVVDADEVFIHCPKAFIRSELWRPESWPSEEERPSAAEMLRAHVADDSLSVEDVERQLGESVRTRLA